MYKKRKQIKNYRKKRWINFKVEERKKCINNLAKWVLLKHYCKRINIYFKHFLNKYFI